MTLQSGHISCKQPTELEGILASCGRRINLDFDNIDPNVDTHIKLILVSVLSKDSHIVVDGTPFTECTH